MPLNHRSRCHKSIALLILLFLFGCGPFGAAASARELKIATWNLNWLTLRPAGDPAIPADVHRRTDVDFVMLQAYAARLQADVVAFQEVDGVEAAAKIFPPDRYDLVVADGKAIQKTGFAIKHGIAWVRNPDLSALDLWPDSPHPLRSGTDITLVLPEGRLRLLDVHLKTGCWEEPLGSSVKACRVLARQVPILADWVQRRASEGEPFAMLGDFNRRMDEDQVIEAAFAPVTMHRAEAGTLSPCWGGEAFIDHILLSGAAAAWMVPGSVRVMTYREDDPQMKDHLSDHCPVSVRLNTPSNP